MEMVSQAQKSEDLATWGETALGVLPVLASGLFFFLLGGDVPLPGAGTGLVLAMLILPVAGILVAWKRDRWGWFPPYFGLLILDLFFIAIILFSPVDENVGLRWLLRGVVILVLLFIAYFLMTLYRQPAARPSPPVQIEFPDILLGFMPWVPASIALFHFGAAVASSAADYIFLGVVVPALGVAIHLRSRWRWLQVAVLVAVFLEVFLLIWNIY